MELHHLRRRLTAAVAATALVATAVTLAAAVPATRWRTSTASGSPAPIGSRPRPPSPPPPSPTARPGRRGQRTRLPRRPRRCCPRAARCCSPSATRCPVRPPRPIDALGATDVLILGGTASVSAAVADELDETTCAVQRIAGNDRYETAAEIATSIGADSVAAVDDLTTAIDRHRPRVRRCPGRRPARHRCEGEDVLPVLLVSDDVPEATSAAIDTLGIEQVIILGGTGAVPAAVQTDLEDQTGNPAVRLAGANRYGTAVAIGEFAADTLEFPVEETILASGLDFADALAGGPLGGVRQAPLLLTDPKPAARGDRGVLRRPRRHDRDDHHARRHRRGVDSDRRATPRPRPRRPPETKTNETDRVSAGDGDEPGERIDPQTYTVTGLGSTAVDIVLLRCRDSCHRRPTARPSSQLERGRVADGTAEAAAAPDDRQHPGAHLGRERHRDQRRATPP